MDAKEYDAMLQRQDYRSLVGILAAIDAEKYPGRLVAVRAEIERRRLNGDASAVDPPASSEPRWNVQKNWHRINAVIVGILSAVSCFSIVTATETGFYLDFEALFFGAAGLAGILLYFRKFRVGHPILLLWWLPQLVEIETRTFKYSLYAAFRFGFEFRLGPLEISTHVPAILSFIWLILFKRYFEARVDSEKATDRPGVAR